MEGVLACNWKPDIVLRKDKETLQVRDHVEESVFIMNKQTGQLSVQLTTVHNPVQGL